MDFFPRRVDRSGQKVTISDDGVPYLSARLQGRVKAVRVVADYAYTEWDFGGEFRGRRQDVEVKAAYEVTAEDVQVFVGYRWSELPAAGTHDGLAYRADFRLDGVFVGASMRF
jgi:hypothetical protein